MPIPHPLILCHATRRKCLKGRPCQHQRPPRALCHSPSPSGSFCLPRIAAAAMVHVPQSAPRDIVLAQARPNLNTQAQIYLLRGLANVFSRGMDEMAATLTSHGFSPQVINHRGAQTAVDTITRNYRGGQRAPVILIGHSLGANAALRMAKSLQRNGIPVAYLATFDPTNALAVPSNVDTFVNFYQNRMGRAGDISAIETPEQGQSQPDHQPRHHPHQYRSDASPAAHRDRPHPADYGAVALTSMPAAARRALPARLPETAAWSAERPVPTDSRDRRWPHGSSTDPVRAVLSRPETTRRN